MSRAALGGVDVLSGPVWGRGFRAVIAAIGPKMLAPPKKAAKNAGSAQKGWADSHGGVTTRRPRAAGTAPAVGSLLREWHASHPAAALRGREPSQSGGPIPPGEPMKTSVRRSGSWAPVPAHAGTRNR